MSCEHDFKIENSCRRIARKIYLKHYEIIPEGGEIHTREKIRNTLLKKRILVNGVDVNGF